MANPNYAKSILGYNIRNDANFFSRWFFLYLNPTFAKGAKEGHLPDKLVTLKHRSGHVAWSSIIDH